MADTTYTRILNLLAEYRTKGLRYEYVRGVYLPAGELPMSAFRGPEVGGDACHMRLWELSAPEEQRINRKGIPIKKSRRHYMGHDGARYHVITYTLDVPLELVDKIIDFAVPRLRIDLLEQYGLKHESYQDDADGADKPGWSVRLIKLNTHQLSLVA